jgi:ribulose-phosphate 3-epimerase
LKTRYISPSVLSADFLNLGEAIEKLNDSEADFIHIDVMDGMFVPNISFGFPVLKAINSVANKPLDVHLMIEQPDRYIEEFVKNGAAMISVHYEACTHLHRTLQLIKSFNVKAGVVLNPHTPISVLEEILPFCDFVLLMSVNPGYGGQSFIDTSFEKIKKLKEKIIERNLNVQIEVDGGANKENAAKLYEYGADILVAGNAVFSQPDIAQAIEDIKHAH